MQIGWCSPKCKFTQDTGVGDTQHSYGLDGSKQRIWHVNTKKYDVSREIKNRKILNNLLIITDTVHTGEVATFMVYA